jgi:predicted nucleic acid-binding protein
MPPYLLDTTVLIDLSRNREPASSWFRRNVHQSGTLGVSTVTIAEFFAGLAIADRTLWERFIDELSHWDVSRDIALQAGIYRHDLARLGRIVLIPDALIAATAAIVGATLVTSNAKDFPMPGMRILRLGP